MPSERRRRLLTHDELSLWREIMLGATAYPGRVIEEGQQPAVATEKQTPLPSAPPRPTEFRLPAASKGTAHKLEHGRTPGVDRNTAERMRKGEMSIDGNLDLHGMTQEAALRALHRFLRSSFESGRRCLLVVTGKGGREGGGGGVLRAQVPQWLNEASLRPLVLAFSYAQPRHGGDGALYVLLKRHR